MRTAVAMSSNNYNLIFSASLFCILTGVHSQQVHRRFEYKYSFKPPYLAQKDGSVPFWEYGGNAIASGESVRLAPSMRSQKGAIWTKSPIDFDWWEVDLMFKVTGRGRIGADGLALWYTAERGEFTGEVFGSSDRWRGLGLIFDSFDNDNKHNNPYIMAVVNDGTKAFDHKSDGSAQLTSGCLRDFRNKPFPTRARVNYYMNTLTVYFHNGMTNNEADYELCFRAEGIVLPRGGHFGVSAATGGLADDHDVLHFLTTSLHSQTQSQDAPAMNAAEQQRLSQEYQEYQKKLEQQKEQYRHDHPDEKLKNDDEEEWFESDGQRELRQIFQGQGRIHDVLRELSTKVDEVIGKQMNSLSMLSAVYGAAQAQGGGKLPAMPQQPGGGGGLPVGRPEWEALVQSSQLALNTIAELKGYIIEVSRKQDVVGSGPAGAAGGPSPQLVLEVRDSLSHLKQGMAGLAQRLQAAPPGVAAASTSCQTVSCVSLTALLTVCGLQLGILIAYNMYRERKEAQAKKFF